MSVLIYSIPSVPNNHDLLIFIRVKYSFFRAALGTVTSETELETFLCCSLKQMQPSLGNELWALRIIPITNIVKLVNLKFFLMHYKGKHFNYCIH